MSNETDKQVQDFFDIVQKKKSEIAKAEKPNWQTNCSFSYIQDSPNRINIQISSNIDEIVSILGFLIEREQFHKKASDTLGVSIKFKWMGYSLEDWQTDLQTRIDKIQINKKKQELEALESRLNSLVSPELKTKLELQEISKLLGK